MLATLAQKLFAAACCSARLRGCFAACRFIASA